jgi:hypothetical protein
LVALKLLDIAARVEEVAEQACQEPHPYRLAGRMARDPARAFLEVIIDGAKHREAFSSMIAKTPGGHALLQCAMREASLRSWEALWNEAHPEQFGMGWQTEDFALMEVWRNQVRDMVEECGQGAILTVTVEKYFDDLTATGVSEEDAKDLADWLYEVHGGYTPST